MHRPSHCRRSWKKYRPPQIEKLPTNMRGVMIGSRPRFLLRLILRDCPIRLRIRDTIGFKPYVRAIAWFLSSERTKPPLTISIEGPWGSGKSSFMLQLQKELEAQNAAKKNQYYIRFNAWRSDKDEALWAAFALTFIKQLERNIDWQARIRANSKLLWNRFEWSHGWLLLARAGIFFVALLLLTIYALYTSIVTDPASKAVLVGVPWLAAVYFGFEKAKKIFGNPLSYDLSKYVRNLQYEDKIAFIDRFQDDFADIVKSYVGDAGRVFVFIDDLDRCEIPRAAELLQAINLLLSADHGNLFFVLGLDREMVAAGIAAKNEKILPYLAAGRAPIARDNLEIARLGIDYGYSFMEKFVQVPFRLPRPDEREIENWVSELVGADDVGNVSAKEPAQTGSSLDIRSGSDPEEFQNVVEKIAEIFGFNPRRLKQFINAFRLRVMVALSTGVLTPAQESAGGASSEGITIQQLGLFTAILMRWSRLAGDLVEEPTLLDQLAVESNQPRTGVGAKWAADDELRTTIHLDPFYSLVGVDLKPLLMIMPDAYFGMLGKQVPEQRKTRLIAGLSGPAGLEISGNIASDSATLNLESVSDLGYGPSASSTGATGPTGSFSTISRSTR